MSKYGTTPSMEPSCRKQSFHINHFFYLIPTGKITGLKREKGTVLGLDYTFNENRESSKIQAYLTEKAPNMGRSIS